MIADLLFLLDTLEDFITPRALGVVRFVTSSASMTSMMSYSVRRPLPSGDRRPEGPSAERDDPYLVLAMEAHN